MATSAIVIDDFPSITRGRVGDVAEGPKVSKTELKNDQKLLTRPKLHRLHVRRLKIDLLISLGVGLATAVAYHYGVCEPRKAAYKLFYATYNPEEDFHRMRNLGLFQYADPDLN